MSTIATHLGHQALAQKYTSWRVEIAQAIQGRFFDRSLGSFGSQGGNTLALAFGVYPEEEHRVFDALVDDILLRQVRPNVGVMGVRFLFEELTRRGRGDLALELLRQDNYPGFGHLIQRGATTLWECWGEDGHNVVHGPRSLNHPFMGGFDNWFYNTLAGIRPDPSNPGFRHFFLDPHPVPGLEWVRAHHESPLGRISSHWSCSKDSFTWEVTIPPDSQVTATLPYSRRVLSLNPGSHRLTDRLPT